MLAIMAHCNTNYPDTKMSPTKVIYGRRLTDSFKFMSSTDKFSDGGATHMEVSVGAERAREQAQLLLPKGADEHSYP